MKSNGFGTNYAQIIVEVKDEHAEQVANDLGADVVSSENGKTRLKWLTSMSYRGDDESIVFDAFATIKAPTGSWSILWDQSDYK